MEYQLNKNDLENLAHGCCFFASGGGGSLSSGLNLLKEFPEDGSVTVISKDEAVNHPEDYTLVVAYIGAPDAIGDLGKPTAAINAFNLMNEQVGGKIKYVVPVELGALSTIVSCVVANKLDLKVVDGDGAGRAVPELTQLTYAASVPMMESRQQENEVVLPSAILASKDDQKVEVFVKTPSGVEAIARPLISADIKGFDQAAGLAIWLMKSDQLDKALSITGTIQLSLDLGNLIKTGLGANPYETVVDFLNSNQLVSDLLFTGMMTEPTEVTQGGFDMDKIVIKNPNDAMHIYAQNESLIAWSTDSTNPIIIAPDSICYLTKDGQVFSNADIDENIIGHEVGVIAIQSRDQLVDSKPIMASFKNALTAIGYPSAYKPWNKI